MRHYITNFRKNQAKGLLLFSLITLTIFVGVNLLGTTGTLTTESTIEPQTSSSLSVPWSGMGDPQSARSYISKSGSEYNQTDEFDITTPTSPSVLNSAYMNFTILSGVETTYEFEQDSPLEYPRSYKNSRSNPGWPSTDSVINNSGIITSGGFSELTDDSTGTSMIVENDTGILKDVTITYTADFTGVTGYQRINTVGFRVLLNRQMGLTNDGVIARIYLYNYFTTSWDQYYEGEWNHAQTVEKITLENYRNAYLNSTDQVQVKIQLTHSNPLTVYFRDLKVEALIATQSSLSTLNYAAMEFDIKGNVNATGFFAWVRTLTPSLPGANLYVNLYRANQTAIRSKVTSASQLNLIPDLSALISTNTISNFDTDEYVFIPFKSDYSHVELNVSNYFVVLNSDVASTYSVVTIPYSDSDSDPLNNDPDQKIDHLFVITKNGGFTWEKVIVGGGQVDAAPFAINLTRAWLPEEINMKVDGIEVISYTDRKGIYENTSGYSWGLGRWNHKFKSIIQDAANVITVPIDFNTTLVSNLDFNVNYSAVAYVKEDTTTNYYVELNELPSWEVNYTLNTGDYTGWNYKNSSFAIPNDWSVEEILDTNYDSLMDNIEFTTRDQISEYWIEPTTNGIYSLTAFSPNYIYETNTYLQYEQNYWKTNGFMQGDNISISLGILNYSSPTSVILSGTSECNVYNPENHLQGYLNMSDSYPDNPESIVIGGETYLLTQYDFNMVNIINTNDTTQEGEYGFVFKWNFSNEIGYKLLPVFVMEYGVDILNITEDLEQHKDVVLSSIETNLTTADTYNVSVFSIENITGTGLDDQYHVNETIGHVYTDYDFDVNVTNILVNESLLNPGEIVTVNVSLENYNHYWANEVTLNAQFIQSTNYDWIVMEENTTVNLGKVGSGTENRTIELEFTVPSDYKGVNGPIRLNPFVLKLEVDINGADLDPIYVDARFPFIEKAETEFEGRVWEQSMILHRPGPIGPIISAEVPRVEELVRSNAIYMIQISDSFYVTGSTTDLKTFSTKPIAQFTDVIATDLVWGKEFQLQGTLCDEFGAEIINQEISVEIYNGTDWIKTNQSSGDPLQSGINGFFNGTYDSTIVAKSTLLKLRLIWNGNSTIFGTSSRIDLQMTTYSNTIQIKFIPSEAQPYLKEKQENTVGFLITNTGNSTLRNFQIDFDFPPISDENIRDGILEDVSLIQLEPNESLYIEYYITVPGSFQGDTASFNLSVSCVTYNSEEYVEFQSEFEIDVLTSSFLDNLDSLFLVFFFVGLIALIGGTVYYVIKTRRKLQEIPQEQKEVRPRRGRYVEVAKLQKKPEKDEVAEKKKSEEKTADLDDLLKEEGLED